MPKSKERERERDDDDAPVRKKKKKKKKQEKSKMPLYAGLGAGGVVLVILFIFVAMKFGGGEKLGPITEWDRFPTDEKDIDFDFPAKGKARGYGTPGKREFEVKGPGSCKINISENITGSLVGNIAGAGSGGVVHDDEHSPLAKVHEMRKPKDLGPSYREDAAETIKTKTGAKIRRSAYTDGSRRGYRATMLLNQSALDMFLDCHVTDWDVLRPAYDRVLESIGPTSP